MTTREKGQGVVGNQWEGNNFQCIFWVLYNFVLMFYTIICNIWPQNFRERTTLCVILLWKQSSDYKPWWTKSAWQIALRIVFGFPEQLDSGKVTVAEIQEKEWWEEVEEGGCGHVLAETRGISNSAESGIRSNVSTGLPIPRTENVVAALC